MDKLSLPSIYRQHDGMMHTSSDAMTFGVAEDCLNASYSRKSLGADKEISVYTFIDMRHFLYHSLVITAAEHEAHYVIDGLMHNDVVKSDIHSTDTGDTVKSSLAPCTYWALGSRPGLRTSASVNSTLSTNARNTSNRDTKSCQTVEKQLNKGENANKFSRAISFGNVDGGMLVTGCDSGRERERASREAMKGLAINIQAIHTALRERGRGSYAELAKYMGLHKQSLSRKLGGRHSIAIEDLNDIAAFLGQDTSDFLVEIPISRRRGARV